MRAQHSKIGRRVLCGLGATALIMTGAINPAFAAEEPTPVTQNIDYGNIDANARGSIIINKHLHQDGTSAVGDPATGEYAGAPAQGVANVEFTIYKLPYNLTTQEGWDQLTAATADGAVPASEGLTVQEVVTTGEDGKVTAGDLPVGAYLVVETNAPAHIVDRAAPFVVTIPFPDTAANQAENPTPSEGWLYNVNVFPKNGETRLNKTIRTQQSYGLNIGSEVHFPVTATIPKVADDRVFEYFQVVDPMDPRFDPASLRVDSVTLAGQPLAAEDYVVSVQGNLVTVSLTKTGLGKLKNNQGSQLEVVFVGKLAKLDLEGQETGRILNMAYVYSNTVSNPGETTPPNPPGTDPSSTPPSTPPTETTPPGATPLVKTFWGDVRILKLDKGDGKTGLQGAEFKIYPAADPYPENGTCTNAIAEGAGAVKASGTEGDDLVVVSDQDGLVKFNGLFVSDDQNDPKSAEQRCYVLVETKAPAGFVTPQDEAARFPVSVKIGQTAATEYDAKVENVKRDTPNLPLTGGTGVMIMMIGGALLLLMSIAAAIAFFRRVRES